jgi:hypothetical protein
MSDDPFIRIAREAAGAPYRPPKSTQQNGGAASPVNDITPIPNTREAVANLIETLGPGMSLMARSSTIEMALDGLGKLRIEPALTDQFLQEIRDRAGTSITELRKMLKKGQRRNKVPIPFGDVARMIERHVYVKQVGAFWDRTARTVVDVKAVREAYWSKMPMDEHGERLDPYGLLIKGEQGFAAERADRFVFRPGADEFFEDDRGCNALNIWVKPKLEPREGDVTPFLGHVEYLLNGDARMIDHQIDFLAHLVQRPEIKMKSTILIVGPPGVGKTFIAEWMVPLLGEENVAFIDSRDLENQFNGYMDGKVLVVVNELIALSKRRATN